MVKNKIGWCDTTWNPVFGCNNGCKYCYARKLSFRFAKEFGKIHGLDPEVFRNFEPVWLEKNFNKKIPKSAKHVFVNSMSDIMHWKKEWKEKVLKKCKEYPEKKFLFLTKSAVMDSINHKISNVYLGKTITNQTDLIEKSTLLVDFISIEPICGRIFLNMDFFGTFSGGLKQIIVGSETGNRKEKIIPKAEWIEEIREFCQANNIKLFEKDSLKDIVKRDLIQERI
jgi:protein gp37